MKIKQLTLSLFSIALLGTLQQTQAGSDPGSLELKQFCNTLTNFDTYKSPRNLCIGSFILAGLRLCGKSYNPNHLTLPKAVKGFSPTNILGYPKHIIQCIDDIIIGYDEKIDNVMYVSLHGRPIHRSRSYGLMGTALSQIRPITQKLHDLKKFREMLLYWKNTLARDWK